jgi:hypothetical protein
MRAPLKFLLAATGLLTLACTTTTDSGLLIGPPLDAPQTLESVSLNEAVELFWSDNAYVSNPTRFDAYRIYSASYDLDHNVCGAWEVEGTTVAPEFLVGALTNGVPRCYGVTSLSTDGAESVNKSPVRSDTPRPDARNVLVYAFGTRPDSSGFRFWDDSDNDGVGQDDELGLIQAGNSPDVDLAIHRNNADSSLWIVPIFSGTSMRPYGPIDDVTSIDFAPVSGYTRDSLRAQVGYGYVFKMVDGTDLHYGAFRVTHVGRQIVILDWSFQTDHGNPELLRRAGLSVSKPTGSAAAR